MYQGLGLYELYLNGKKVGNQVSGALLQPIIQNQFCTIPTM